MRLGLSLTILLTSSAAAEEVFYLDPALFDDADVVIVGELHDQAEHHLTQAAIVALLRPTAVVFEMLTAEQATLVTSENLADPDLGETLGWQAAGWPDFAIYAPIFASMGNAVAVGAAADEATIAKARDDGAAAAIDDPIYGLDAPLPETEQALREHGMQDVHCGALPEDILPWFVDQQRFADAAFTQATLAALDTYGAPVVVITGNGHARNDWGMPSFLARVAPTVAVISVGQIVEPDPAAPYDYWKVLGSIDTSQDPCTAFK